MIENVTPQADNSLENQRNHVNTYSAAPFHLDLDEPLSEHFRLSEFIASGTALIHHIDNTPQDSLVVERLRALVQNVLEPLRRRFGAIRITSGYRCPKLNALVGGRSHSQHLRGEAADIHISSREKALKMFAFIRDHCDFDQLLFEHRMNNGCCWLHVSYKMAPARNRHEAISNYPG